MLFLAGLAVAAASIGVSVSGYTVVAAGDPVAIQLAALNPADAIAERQKLMKAQGGHAKAINDYLESGTGTAADVAAHAAALKESAGKIADLFVPGSSIDDNVAKTAAKKEIWASFDEFKAAAAKLGDLAGALEVAAGTGDNEQIAAAFGAMGKEGCGGCHSKFRQKTE
jgi:cytochrome c556